MKQLTVLCAVINCNDLMEEITILYPYDVDEELQPFAEYINDLQIDHKEVEEMMEVLHEHGIIDKYDELTEWSQKNGVGMVVNRDDYLSGFENLFLQEVHLISKQGKMLIEKLCPQVRY